MNNNNNALGVAGKGRSRLARHFHAYMRDRGRQTGRQAFPRARGPFHHRECRCVRPMSSPASSMYPSSSQSQQPVNHQGKESTLFLALDIESKNDFPNMKGRRFPTFHTFLLSKLQDLQTAILARKRNGCHDDLDSEALKKLEALLEEVREYPHIEHDARKELVERIRMLFLASELLEDTSQRPPSPSPTPPRPRSAVRARPSSARPTRPGPPTPSPLSKSSATLEDLKKRSNLFIFDLETTGFSSRDDRIVEIAATALHSGECYAALVDPGDRQIDPRAAAVTGITRELLEQEGAKPFSEVVKDFMAFIEANTQSDVVDEDVAHAVDGITLIAHNANRFDARFLCSAFAREGLSMPEDWYFYDTMHLARSSLANRDPPRSYSLSSVNAHLGLPRPSTEHRAMADVEVLTGVFEKLVGLYSSVERTAEWMRGQRSHGVDVHANAVQNMKKYAPPRSRYQPQTRQQNRPQERAVRRVAEDIGALTKPTFKMDSDPISILDIMKKSEENKDDQISNSSIAHSPSGWILSSDQELFLSSGILIDDVKELTLTQRQLAREAGFDTLLTLLQHYPRDYLFYSPSTFRSEDLVYAQGRVESVSTFVTPRNKGCIHVIVKATDPSNAEIEHTVDTKQWMNFGPWNYGGRALKAIAARTPTGSLVAFKGKLKESGKNRAENDPCTQWELSGSVELTPLDGATELERETLPIYPARGTIKSPLFHKMLSRSLTAFDRWALGTGDANDNAELDDQNGDGLGGVSSSGVSYAPLDILPEDVRSKYELMGYRDAMHKIHLPSSLEEAEEARRSLVFQELFLLQAALLLRRHQMQTPRSVVDAQGVCIGDHSLVDRTRERLSYTLTGAQERVLDDILTDLSLGIPPMMRLLQGDVGSGKTVVAILAMMAAAGSGWQSAMMAPTEILALQHAQNLEALLDTLDFEEGTRPEVVALTGGMRASAKKDVIQQIADGTASIVIGTHALISEGVQFLKLGLAVIDEQHKFGVEQRSKLQSKNQPPPHLLSMSATPIPRTLALATYGEMALSYIDEMPKGRLPVKTFAVKQESAGERSSVYSKLVAEVQKGNKGFVVFPLIEESTATMNGANDQSTEYLQSIKAAEVAFRDLQENELKGIPCGLLHGRLQPQDKLAAQHAFVKGETKVLVATAVVEVGVDIPEATMMIVENAERFGLAQLHQLRGRVGRSENKQAFCYLLTAGSEASHSRVQHMEELDSGFAVSEVDMAIRGPGDFLGTKQAGQSGLSNLQLADMKSPKDRELLENAREAAAGFFPAGTPRLPTGIELCLKHRSPLPALDILPGNIEPAQDE